MGLVPTSQRDDPRGSRRPLEEQRAYEYDDGTLKAEKFDYELQLGHGTEPPDGTVDRIVRFEYDDRGRLAKKPGMVKMTEKVRRTVTSTRGGNTPGTTGETLREC